MAMIPLFRWELLHHMGELANGWELANYCRKILPTHIISILVLDLGKRNQALMKYKLDM